MKHQELNDITTLEIEATDERSSVLDWLFYNVGQYDQQPFIVVLPQDAVFRRPGDLRELQQVTASQNAQLILVIEGNERLRLWARRHGFTVYSTMETCQKALAQPGGFQSLHSVYAGWQTTSDAWMPREQSPVSSFTGSWNTHGYTDENTLGETYRSAATGIAVDNSRRTTGSMQQSETVGKASTAVFERPQMALDISFYRDTEPLAGLPNYATARRELRARQARTTLTLVEEVDAPFSTNLEFSLETHETREQLDKLVPFGEEVPTFQVATRTSPLLTLVQQVRQDRILLFLVILIILCIVGGVSFGYILEMLRNAPASSASAPASLIHTMFWGIE
jgi:hypothetical protein